MAKSSSDRAETGPGAPTACVLTLGCKVNQYESAAIAEALTRAGYRLVEKDRPADLTVVNTCTVTHKADLEAGNLVRRAHRMNPEGRIVVTGCLVQLRPETFADAPGVALVLGQDEKTDLPARLENGMPGAVHITPPGSSGAILDCGFPDFQRTRVFFRVQDGCNDHCTYCTIPAARGPSRSLPLERVVQGVRTYARAGYAEIVLTGIHLGAWGADLGIDRGIERLVESLISIGPRLRLSSIEPVELTDQLIELASASENVCPHFHLPLQSGSDRTLRRMGRPYRADFFAGRVARLVEAMPDVCIGADILVGFPGETDEEFAETYGLVEKLPLAYFHVFPYSKRPGTPAERFDHQVMEKVKKDRVRVLRELGRAKRLAYNRRFIGSARPTLVENSRDRKTGLGRGLTDNYIQVLLPDPVPPGGSMGPVVLESVPESGPALGRPENDREGA